jgi:hypothetical protein
MPVPIKPSLLALSEEQVLRAIASGGEDNLILQELAYLINAYVKECASLTAAGKNPTALLEREPRCAIEKIAIGMVVAAAKAEKKDKT